MTSFKRESHRPPATGGPVRRVRGATKSLAETLQKLPIFYGLIRHLIFNGIFCSNYGYHIGMKLKDFIGEITREELKRLLLIYDITFHYKYININDLEKYEQG